MGKLRFDLNFISSPRRLKLNILKEIQFSDYVISGLPMVLPNQYNKILFNFPNIRVMPTAANP